MALHVIRIHENCWGELINRPYIAFDPTVC